MIRIVMMLFLVTMVCMGADDSEFRGEAKAKIEMLQHQNDELKTKIDSLDDKVKSVDTYKDQIQEVNTHVDRSINILAIVLALSGVLGYFSVKSRAKDEAREAAKEWFKENSNDLTKQIQELTTLKNVAKVKTEEHHHYLQKSREDIEKAKEGIIRNLKSSNEKVNIVSSSGNLISDEAEFIRQTKPQNKYLFDDWDTLAFDLYENKKYEEAKYHWEKAIELGNPTEEEYVNAQYMIGHTFEKLGEEQKAITTYDELLTRFFTSQSQTIEIVIANAFVSKGYTLSKIREYDKEINTYDMLFRRFPGKQPLEIEEPLSKALANKGVSLGDLKKYEEAIAVYEEHFIRFKGKHDSSLIKENLIGTLLNLFELQVVTSKLFDENKVEYFRQIATKRDLLVFEVLEIIRGSLQCEQSQKIQKAKEDFADIEIENWSWQELFNWANGFSDLDAKERVLNTIEVFRNWTVTSDKGIE